MCSKNILHQNATGYVLECQQCRRIQLVFGQIVVSMTKREFYRFVARVSHFCDLEKDQCHTGQRNIVLDTHDHAISFVFSYEELLRLEMLIGQAAVSLEAQMILSPDEP